MRTMFFLIIYMTLVGLCFAYDSNGRSPVNYHRMADNSAFRSMNDNPFMVLSKIDDQGLLKIEYYRTITYDTGLMVGVFCGVDDGFPDDSDEDDDLLNLCELLDNALLEPESSEAYNMARHFGINGSSCPIYPGVRTLTEPHVMLASHDVTTRDIDCNVTYYKVKVMPGNNTLGENATMERRMDLDPTRKNGTFIQNSSGIFTMPSIAVSIVICLFAISFNY